MYRMLQVAFAGSSKRRSVKLNQSHRKTISFETIFIPSQVLISNLQKPLKNPKSLFTHSTIRHFQYLNMNYQQRIQVAGKIILDHDARRTDNASLNHEELGLKCTLKPYQMEGVSWLIRRYKLGVNVVLGEIYIYISFL